jgi:DNA-binding MarR family transcriptional regulator
MTGPSAIPEEVLHFIDRYVESLDQLEILRTLGESRSKDWTATDLAKEAQIKPGAITAHLTALEQRGLLTMQRSQSECVCRYGAKTPELEKQLSGLLQFYKERPVTLIKIIYAQAQDRLKAFAESFRLRKES